jgi:phosphatidylglycerol:prolipoprotein diacylglycerol transferase
VGPYLHDIDPIIGSIAGVHFWWYGLTYVAGFLVTLLVLRSRRHALGLSIPAVDSLTLFVTAGVLVGGRFVQVVFYEWPFYREFPQLIPAYWLGGMASHGLLLGGVAGIALFCWTRGRPILPVADALAAPAAFILGVGRLGNFADGQIVGGVTDVWWAFKFPDADGFRHPVVLYDSAKNLMLIPLLVYVGRRGAGTGVVTGLFLFLYAFLRLFVDLFREYPTSLLGLATGQALNLAMAAIGLALLVWSMRARRTAPPPAQLADTSRAATGLIWKRVAFGALLVFSLTLPSDWTQDVPARYGKRHPGLEYSPIYPPIDAYREKLPRSSRASGAFRGAMLMRNPDCQSATRGL